MQYCLYLSGSICLSPIALSCIFNVVGGGSGDGAVGTVVRQWVMLCGGGFGAYLYQQQYVCACQACGMFGTVCFEPLRQSFLHTTIVVHYSNGVDSSLQHNNTGPSAELRYIVCNYHTIPWYRTGAVLGRKLMASKRPAHQKSHKISFPHNLISQCQNAVTSTDILNSERGCKILQDNDSFTTGRAQQHNESFITDRQRSSSL